MASKCQFGNNGFSDFLPKVKLEIVVPEDRVEQVVETVMKSAHTGRIGDGKIFVLPMDEAYQVDRDVVGPEAI